MIVAILSWYFLCSLLYDTHIAQGIGLVHSAVMIGKLIIVRGYYAVWLRFLHFVCIFYGLYLSYFLAVALLVVFSFSI